MRPVLARISTSCTVRAKVISGLNRSNKLADSLDSESLVDIGGLRRLLSNNRRPRNEHHGDMDLTVSHAALVRALAVHLGEDICAPCSALDRDREQRL